MKNLSSKIKAKQKRFFLALAAGFTVMAGILVSFVSEEEKKAPQPEEESSLHLDSISQEIDPEVIRLSNLESENEALGARLESMEIALLQLQKEKELAEKEKGSVSQETQDLMKKMEALEQQIENEHAAKAVVEKSGGESIQVWETARKKEDKHVLFEIPAGTVLKAVLVSGADCSVAVQKPTGPNMVLLRPIDNGQLPRKVRVPLKGSVIIGNAIGDISSERVYIRTERMTLVERGGSFVETEISGYISGEDGREGMRGVVVDRSGQIVTRAAFAAFLQGIGQTIEATLNNQSLSKIDKERPLNIEMFRNSGLHGSATGLGKLSDYYIKRAEQLQPAIQIAAGRVVDVVFTKTVKIGEKDLKKKFEMERAAKRGLYE